MTLSYSAVWDDLTAMARANSSVLLAIAGVFLFLPGLLVAYFIPQPQSDASRILADLWTYHAANAHWLLLGTIVNMAGAIAMLLLLLDRDGRTVGNAIAGTLPILPAYFIASLLAGLAIGCGLLLLIVPGLYLFGRLAVLGPVLVTEERHPLRALARSFELTRGKGWAIIGLVALVAAAALVLGFALIAVVGTLFRLLASDRLELLLVAMLSAFASAMLSGVLILLYAALYRRLAGAGPSSGT
ncbi:MAG TPA: YciC family protein [Allosphingosinicella sp.]|nr:YciC family protein [Allosphingosinicella sp.]